MASSYSLTGILNNAFDERTNNLYTAIPCIIIAIRNDLNDMMVDIQPSINQRSEDGVVTPRTPILGVPVQFPVSKSAGFTFPLNVGDTGMAIFSMRNLDSWKSGNGYPSAPMNAAKFDKGDAALSQDIMHFLRDWLTKHIMNTDKAFAKALIQKGVN